MKRYPILLLATLAACFCGQSLALKWVGGKTKKSESNYFSSVARLQTEADGQPEVLFLGSSLTGRLPERPESGNLGCDGGSAVITLRAIDEGLLPAAKVIFVEANTLAYELDGLGKETASAIRSEWFQIGREIPNFGATARPTAFVYSWLESKRGGLKGSPSEQDGSPFARTGFSTKSAVPSLKGAAEDHLVEEISGIIRRLVERGSDVRLVFLPEGGNEDAREVRIAEAVAAETQRPWWNLNEGISFGAIGYTDGRHMDAASAAVVVDALLRAR